MMDTSAPIHHKTVSFEDTSIAFASRSEWELWKMNLMFGAINRNWLVKLGTTAIKTSFKWGLPIKGIVKTTIFEHFCGGEDIEDCAKAIDKLAQYRIGTILDYSVEGEKTELGFEKTTYEIIRTIDKAAKNPDKIPFSVFKVTGLASFDLLAKVQRGDALSQNETEAWQRVCARVERICAMAHQRKVRIFIDAEESWIQEAIDGLAYKMMEQFNREQAIVYNTYQMYAHRSLAELKSAHRIAQQHGYYLGVKLVRGAYIEKERNRAAELGLPDPMQPDKSSTDRDFDAGLEFCLAHIDRIALCAGTHNEQSTQYLISLMDKQGIAPNDTRVYFAQLYGMSDHISYNLADAGFNVAKYVPYGPVKAVLPYLFRRAEENTSVAGQSSREFLLIQKERNRRRQK